MNNIQLDTVFILGYIFVHFVQFSGRLMEINNCSCVSPVSHFIVDLTHLFFQNQEWRSQDQCPNFVYYFVDLTVLSSKGETDPYSNILEKCPFSFIRCPNFFVAMGHIPYLEQFLEWPLWIPNPNPLLWLNFCLLNLFWDDT